MTKDIQSVNNTIAPLSNVMRFTELVERLVDRPPELPGFGVFSGKAGLGKSFSAIYAINKYRAHYVECDYTWTQKAFCEAVMVELGLLAPRTRLTMPVYRAVAEIGDKLADNPLRPLIIDEADFLVRRKMIEIVRAIYKHCAGAGTAIILIGEESMPNALRMWERVDSRVLKSVKAEKINADDVAILSKMVASDLNFSKETNQRLLQKSNGSARRLVTLLHDINEAAKLNGWKEITPENLEEL